jgi:methyl-accepting chemotaxis protein
MNDVTPPGNSLDLAAAQLRELCDQREQFAAPLDTASLGRMINHIRNIRRSIDESADDHSNAAKRLTDFSMVLGRIARNVPQESEELAHRLRRIAHTLKEAGSQIATPSSAPGRPPGGSGEPASAAG